MSKGFPILLGCFVLALVPSSRGQNAGLRVPSAITAGAAFSVHTSGTGKAVLYIIGPAQVVRREIERGETTVFPPGSMHNAGHYLVTVTGEGAPETASMDVSPEGQPAALNLLAKPSRLPVDLHDGISGAVYLFDTYGNLITAPIPVSFELSTSTGPVQTRTVITHEGEAWTEMDSTAKEGAAKFIARVGSLSTARVIEQVPGDPCSLRVSAHRAGQKLQLETDPVRDCRGNAVPDGTIVTFTENSNSGQSTVDVPLKRGVARVEMPAHDGAKISVASGVVMGNEVRW